MANKLTSIQLPKKSNHHIPSNIYDQINTAGANAQNFVKAGHKFNFVSKKVKGTFKVKLRKTIPISGVLSAKVWKNAVGSTLDIVETSVTTYSFGSELTGDIIYEFPFTGDGGFLTNANVIVGVEWVGGAASMRFTDFSNATDPNTSLFSYHSGPVWNNQSVDVAMTVPIETEAAIIPATEFILLKKPNLTSITYTADTKLADGSGLSFSFGSDGGNSKKIGQKIALNKERIKYLKVKFRHQRAFTGTITCEIRKDDGFPGTLIETSSNSYVDADFGVPLSFDTKTFNFSNPIFRTETVRIIVILTPVPANSSMMVLATFGPPPDMRDIFTDESGNFPNQWTDDSNRDVQGELALESAPTNILASSSKLTTRTSEVEFES